MIDKAALGRHGAPFELDIERGKVREFARAVHARDRAFFDGEHPIAPPTFLTTTFFWEMDVADANPWALVKMDQRRGMHAEQEYVFYGPPPRAGARLRCRSRISDIFEKQGKRGGVLRFAVMVTEFHDRDGALVAEARMTGVETELVSVAPVSAPALAQASAASPAAERRAGADTSALACEGNIDPFEIGPITRTDFVRYQGASGDMNPVHHDEEFARAAGYPAPLGVGMFPAGVMMAWAAGAVGPERIRRARVRWKEPVFPGDVLLFTAARADSADGSVELQLRCTRGSAGVAVEGTAVFAPP
jgi:acyl dehydratase